MHKPEDQAVSVGPSPLFLSRSISETPKVLIKLISSFLLWSSKCPQLCQLPAASPGIFRPLQQVQGWHRAYLLTLFPEDVQDMQTSIPHWGHGAHGVRRQHGWRTLTPGHPCPLQSPLGMVGKPQRGDREKQQGVSEANGKMSNCTHGMSPSLLKRACCGHGVSGDCLDPIAKTFIACLGHL